MLVSIAAGFSYHFLRYLISYEFYVLVLFFVGVVLAYIFAFIKILIIITLLLIKWEGGARE